MEALASSPAIAMALRSPSLQHLSSLVPRISRTALQCIRTSSGNRISSHTFGSEAKINGHRSARLFCVRARRDEEVEAKMAAENLDTSSPTIFDKIVSKEIPATIVYEDEKVLAFRDINPQAPVHVVLIPKKRDGLTQLSKASERNKDVLGELLYAAKLVAEQEGLQEGFRVVINDGPQGCQSVYHLHLHLIGGRQLKWPPG